MAQRTPAAWLDLLERRLHERWNRWVLYDSYYEGEHRLAFASKSYRNRFGVLLAHLVSNWMPLVVDTAAERLRVQGFRFGKNQDADDDAWGIWQANGLDAQANMVHTEAIKLGEAYWLVQPNGELPKITCEHPSQVIVAYAPGDRRERLAALKKWVDEDNYARANIYLPEGVAKYRSESAIDKGGITGGRVNWKRDGQAPNPLGVVPVIPMPNNPSMLKGGESDLARGAVAIQDAINKMLGDSQVSSESHALPQRVMLGVEPPRNPATGEIISDQQMADGQIWYFNQPEAKAFEFSQGDMKQLRELVDGQVGDLAAQTRIPIYYFRPQAISNISAEALIGLDAGLVSKVHDKETPFGEGHEETMRLAFKSISADDPRAAAFDAETIWQDTESRSQAQLTDAVSKEVAMGLPFESALEKLGYSPQAVDRILSLREADALLAQTLAPKINGNEATNGGVPALPAAN